MSASSHDEHPAASARRSRPQHCQEASEGPSADPHHRHHPRSQPHRLSSEPRHPAHVFDLVYALVFSLVHGALTAVLAPVLGTSPRRQRTPSLATSPESPRSLPRVECEEDDVESGRSVGSRSSSSSLGSHSSHHSSSGHSNGGSYPPILRTASRPCPTNKSVRFPAPERPRPPLGRIGGAPSSSAGARPSSRRDPTAVSSRRPRGRSPLGRLAGARMHQSSYFLE